MYSKKCFWAHDEFKSHIHSPFISDFGLHQHQYLAALMSEMLRCVHQLVGDFISLLFGIGQVSFFAENVFLLQHR